MVTRRRRVYKGNDDDDDDNDDDLCCTTTNDYKLFNSFRGLFDVYSFPGIVLAQIADDVPHVRLVQDREIARGLGEQSAFDWSTILSPFPQIVSVGLD